MPRTVKKKDISTNDISINETLNSLTETKK